MHRTLRQRTLRCFAILALAASQSHAAEGLASGIASGISTEFMQPSIRPQDDFNGYVNGKWHATVQIPPDRPMWGSFDQLTDTTLPQLRTIIEQAEAADPSRDPDARRIGDFYASFMDEARLEQLGVTPLQAEFDRIAALKDKSALAALLAHLTRIGVDLPFSFSLHQDNKDATRYVVRLDQDGLGMPNPDYYLKPDDKKLAGIRAAYLAHIGKMLAMAGVGTGARAGVDARAVLDLETAMAKAQWSPVELRDPVKAYNKVALAGLGRLAPGFDWQRWQDAVGLSGKASEVIVGQPSYLKAFAALVEATPLDTWKAYLDMRLLGAYSAYLSKAFVDAHSGFMHKTLYGIDSNQPRWKRGVGVIESTQGEALGKLYVAAHFPPERRARADAMVRNVLAAFRQSIDGLDWMTPATKKAAQAKLAKISRKIGYPSRWKDYSKLVVKRDDLVGNVSRSRTLEFNRELAKLGKPIDREAWEMTPQTVNAYYNPEMNEIVFPAVMFQPPFFDADAEDAVNYGAIGGVIGHEASHAFDDQGAQYDGDGNLRDWWSAADHRQFDAKAKLLVAQYDGLEPLPGYHVNGQLTLGENIADDSGVAIAYKAYRLSLAGKAAPVIGGLSAAQRFHIGWAQIWREKMQDDFRIMLLKSDPHSPGPLRINVTLRNEPSFYEAYALKPGDKMYLAPKDRVSIW